MLRRHMSTSVTQLKGQVHRAVCSTGYRSSTCSKGDWLTFVLALFRPPLHRQLQLILGPMFSGKSTELIRRVRRYEHARQRCLLVSCEGCCPPSQCSVIELGGLPCAQVKYTRDTRYTETDQISTHDNAGVIDAKPCETLLSLEGHLDQ